MNIDQTITEEKKIQEPTGCFCCGKDSDGFQTCIDCGVQCFMEELDPLYYCEKHNPERFKMIMDWYDTIKNVTGSGVINENINL